VKLYSYFRSSAAFRVRIALNLKQLNCEIIPVHLVKNGGEQHAPAFQVLSPRGEVPCLVDGDVVLSQSMAILDYLESKFPSPKLTGATYQERARVIELSEMINSGIHPVQNLKVLQKLEKDFFSKDEQKESWARHWIEDGFTAFEKRLEQSSGKFCVGDSISWADIYLVPQVFNAKRYKVNMEKFPKIADIDSRCMQMAEFIKADPMHQVDTPSELKSKP